MEAPPVSWPGPPEPDDPFAEIAAGLAAGASDWQFKEGEPCHLRVQGAMGPIDQPPLPERRIRAVWRAALGESVPFAPGLDVSFEHRGEYFRVHAFSCQGAPCFNLRHIPSRVPELARLGLPAAFEEAVRRSARGLILVTGPSGSGKSTTLAAAVDHRNRLLPEVICTLEDPVEFRHRNRRGVVRQMEKGRDFSGFAQALHGALRSDPDVILLGEMRDAETIAAALTAAETGHLVLGTLHCATARDAVSRVIDACPADRTAEIRAQLARNVVAVLAQQLVPSRDGKRAGAFELMLATPGVRSLIADPAGKYSLLPHEIATGSAQGMIAMDQSLADLWRRRAIERGVALRFAVNAAALEPLLKA